MMKKDLRARKVPPAAARASHSSRRRRRQRNQLSRILIPLRSLGNEKTELALVYLENVALTTRLRCAAARNQTPDWARAEKQKLF
jgi:hypothetical protein